MAIILLKKPGKVAQFADWLLVSLMRLVSGAPNESPQRTHRWNNRRLTCVETEQLDQTLMFRCVGSSDAVKRRWFLGLPIFHLPILGGWREYVVLRPSGLRAGYNEVWYLGWQPAEFAGVSLLELRGPARALVGGEGVSFFAVNKYGEQIPIVAIGCGRIGDGSPYGQLPLL